MLLNPFSLKAAPETGISEQLALRGSVHRAKIPERATLEALPG
jgi:hypothetical protein